MRLVPEKHSIQYTVEAPKKLANSFDWGRFDIYDRPKIGFSFSEKNIKSQQPINIILDSNVFFLPLDLKDVAEEIEYSKEYLSYEDDWDGLGSLAIKKEVYYESINWLIKHVLYVYNTSGIITKGLEINVCPNGTIDFSWVTNSARLLINFKGFEDKIEGRFYGLSTENEVSNDKKGSVNMNSNIDETLAVWMKFLA